MNHKAKYDVAIIGRGITAASTAWHLAQAGCENIMIIGPDRQQDGCASLCPGFVTGAMIDNVTRLQHGHGAEIAEAVLGLGVRGFEGMKAFAHACGVAFSEGQVRRFATTDHEKLEMTQAVEILKSLRYKATMSTAQGDLDPENIVALQVDGLASAMVDPRDILNKLEQESRAEIYSGSARSLKVNSHQAEIICEQGTTIRSEMVVVAAHLATPLFIPNLEGALVSFADQWISCRPKNPKVQIPVGNLLIGHHGHYTACSDVSGTLYLTGARFLRKWAGVEARVAEVLPAVTDHLLKNARTWFGFDEAYDVSARGVLDCRPCDELPIIGPMFGEDRVMVGTGYMGAGLALGFAAGKNLADLVVSGKAPQLHPALHPRRLRSMAT